MSEVGPSGNNLKPVAWRSRRSGRGCAIFALGGRSPAPRSSPLQSRPTGRGPTWSAGVAVRPRPQGSGARELDGLEQGVVGSGHGHQLPFPRPSVCRDGWIGPRALLVRTAGAAQTWGKPTGARPTSALQPGATTQPGGLGRGHLGATGTNPLSHNDRRRSWCQPWAGPGRRA